MIHLEFKVSHVVFLDEKHFFRHSKFASQPDSTDQPYLNLMLEREIKPAGQFDGRQLAPGQPARVTLARGTDVEVQFPLCIHPQTDLASTGRKRFYPIARPHQGMFWRAGL
jgi:hypothetical protein